MRQAVRIDMIHETLVEMDVLLFSLRLMGRGDAATAMLPGSVNKMLCFSHTNLFNQQGRPTNLG